jgi:sterol desaturase/sphingolipid hydroxylase (fatty acid hydroxylase superfamily)
MTESAWFWSFWGLLILLSTFELVNASRTERGKATTRWHANIGLGLINGLMASLLPISTVLSAQWAESHGIGLLHWAAAPFWFAAVVTVAVRSLAQYLWHRLAHRVPTLWKLHHVHHSDPHLDATSGLRFHPGEMLGASLFIMFFTVATGLSPFVLIIFEIVESVVGIATHTSLRLSRRVELHLQMLFVTPTLHHVHHSSDLTEANSNFGTFLVVWDRLFATYRAEPQRTPDKFELGLPDVDPAQAKKLTWLLSSPWSRH